MYLKFLGVLKNCSNLARKSCEVEEEGLVVEALFLLEILDELLRVQDEQGDLVDHLL